MRSKRAEETKGRAASFEAADADFLAGYDPDEFAHPSLAVDVVIMSVVGDNLVVVLSRREEPPQKERWSLPGGFVGVSESLEHATHRVLHDKAGLADVYVEQLYTFGGVDRDPRTRVVSVAYLALVPAEKLKAISANATIARVSAERHPGGGGVVRDEQGNVMSLAFDHEEIVAKAVTRLQGKLEYAPVGYELLESRFTLRELQTIHEAILGRGLNKDSFRKKVLTGGNVVATGTREEGVKWRPAELYRFKSAPKKG